MSFEFNRDDTFTKYPNPYRFENVFLAIGAAAALAGGIASVIHAREFFMVHEDRVALIVVAVAVLVLGLAVKLLIQALSQVRFYLGRKFPLGLAGELAVTDKGMGEGADKVLETLRHRAIEFPEPRGALESLLCSLVKDLVTSPTEVRAAAVQHFRALIAMGALLASLLVSYLVFAGTSCEGFASWLYLPMSGLSLLTPFMAPDRLSPSDRHDTPVAETGDRALTKLVGLVVFSIMAPVLLPRVTPHVSIAPMWIPSALLLGGSMISSGLFFAATLCHLGSARSTDVSCEQTTIAMNCPPGQLWAAISRDFQSAWERAIPNRAYANVPPDVSRGERGSFSGLILEETQPAPMNSSQLSSWAEAVHVPYARMLLVLGAWGIAMAAFCGWTAARATEQFAKMSATEISRSILVIMALGMVAALSFRIGHLLWSRIEFRSRLVWIETSGVFQTSRISVGNRFRSNVQSSSTLTRVEGATLRVWVADIVSVAFGRDGKRTVIAMAAADDTARSTVNSLVAFAANQCVVPALTAKRDLARASSIGRLSAAAHVETTALG
ncbi:hypothetical protein [Massilia sp. CT11-137]|uniref:hypothetical protein n=1 Tax=Massilia sp. CT11-137 TaxID=3393901 RepID=UPI0039A45F76